MLLDPADEERLRSLITRFAVRAAAEMPEASEEELIEYVTHLVVAEIQRLRAADDDWARRVAEDLL
jgi:hypothetical protein